MTIVFVGSELVVKFIFLRVYKYVYISKFISTEVYVGVGIPAGYGWVIDSNLLWGCVRPSRAWHFGLKGFLT